MNASLDTVEPPSYELSASHGMRRAGAEIEAGADRHRKGFFHLAYCLRIRLAQETCLRQAYPFPPQPESYRDGE